MSRTATAGRHSLALSLVLALLAPPAFAHTPATGLGPLADGAARLVLEPADLLLSIALVLLALQQHPPAVRRVIVLLPALWCLGAVLGQALPRELLLAPLITATFVVVALLVALQIRLPPWLFTGLAAATSLGFGVVNGSLLSGHAGSLSVVLGEAVALAVFAVVLAMGLEGLRFRWRAIALRVAGSWIAASGLLMLGWQLRHPQ
ncbi:HupE/UreJ family protein [Synechococcus sp. CS-1325]|uniref:HupE/UreJ family protein n=1 Tax=Synechococcus sp. CS-1325 TaxID=2847979 RepID=UPI00223B701E|nr:HupE/UreJ family protein [Synechococcus sp. CS-1325]MCT0199017.1 HupE/UreJ family protein [Synechococcus sp. CS-1325]